MKLQRTLVASVAAFGIWLTGTLTVLAASPSPSSATGGDPRSSGQGPGLVGDPAAALLTVVAIGVGAVLVTLLYLRLTAHRVG